VWRTLGNEVVVEDGLSEVALVDLVSNIVGGHGDLVASGGGDGAVLHLAAASGNDGA